jgi:uracil-DNA glycosylase
MSALLEQVHPEWNNILKEALSSLNPEYLQSLLSQEDWLPGKDNLFAAFSQPLSQTRYILLGESPYPRKCSANGYAFWDNAVSSLWSNSGLSKEVNRATSLRNFIKMLLHARGDLINDFSQAAIACIDKTSLVQTGREFFTAFLNHGFLLLNASLVYRENEVPAHAKEWRPFMHTLLNRLAQENSSIELILFGKIATQIPEKSLFSHLIAEHPYNISFITNPVVISFFKPLDILSS